MNITENIQEFILAYKIALKLNISRENLASILGWTTDSVRRKVGKINEKYGLGLSQLPLKNDQTLTDQLKTKFYEEYSKLENKNKEKEKNSKIYLITAAQNATPVHKQFLESCKKYCEYRNAELIIVPYRYKNPTSLWTLENEAHEWWSPAISEYICDYRTNLADSLVLLGDLKIQPTQSEPLSGLDGFTGNNSCIVGHPNVQLVSVATLNNKPKILVTTGSVTIPNYTDSKAGYKARFNHSIGALVVEVDDDGFFHIRHVHASEKTGEFYDLDKLYTPTEVKEGIRVEALVTGDTHAEFIDETVENVTYHNKDSIVNVLRPKKIVLHDVLDFYARNHHHRGNDIISYGKHKYALRNNVQEGLQQAADFIDRISRKDTEVIIVKSNHDEALDKWLMETDIKNDPENADFFYYMKYHQMKSIKATETGFYSFDPFKFWCENPENGKGLKNIKTTRFLNRGESLRICSIEVGFHGDIGISGSKASLKSMSRLSEKIVIGHSHTPGIMSGCYQVGTSSKLNLEYKKGPSSWMQTHCVIYPDGKRTLINIINNRWKK